jgi:hypothetical protein
MNAGDNDKCPNCGGLISVRNPTGKCDHLYYPENVVKINNDRNGEVEELAKFLGTLITTRVNFTHRGDCEIVADFIIAEGYSKTPPIESGKVPSVEDIYMELCFECGNKERGDLLNSKEKEAELWRYAQAIVTYLEGGKN